MTDEELIARLRDGCNLQQRDGERAANRIEALTKERDRWKDACRSASRDLNIVVPDNDRLKSERDAAEAKLAKAVEALERALKYNTAMHGGAGAYNKQIKDAIAELKGESHE